MMAQSLMDASAIMINKDGTYMLILGFEGHETPLSVR